MNKERRKHIGAFYTPYDAAKTIADWAIQNKTDYVLEPSFGGCNFLEACRDRLGELGNQDVFDNIYGCDIDDDAFQNYLYKVQGIDSKINHFVLSDFLDTSIDDFGGKKFDVVIGNPPYVGYHSMSKLQRDTSREVCSIRGLDLKGVFSLWVPFVVKSLQFLKDGGRIGFVLPNSLLDSHYAKIVNKWLESQFAKITAVRISERLFVSDGTNEISVILLCEGYNSDQTSTCNKLVGHINRISELSSFFQSDTGYSTEGSISDRYNSMFTNSKLNRVINKVTKYDTLGSVYTIKIGIVTGSNKFFIVNKNIIKEKNIRKEYVRFILKNGKLAPGIKINLSEINNLYDLNENICLVSSEDNSELDEAFLSYLNGLPEDFILKNKTFKKRDPWHAVKYESIPDAFMTCMTAAGPKIINNEASITCTNNMYRLFSKKPLSEKQSLLFSLSILTSYGQLSSELNGKNYGSGVLKLEPSACQNIRLMKYLGPKNITTIRKVYLEIDNLTRLGKSKEAMALADDFFIKSYNGSLNQISDLLQTIRNARYRYHG